VNVPSSLSVQVALLWQLFVDRDLQAPAMVVGFGFLVVVDFGGFLQTVPSPTSVPLHLHVNVPSSLSVQEALA
jgi:hypothetical protein